MTSTFSSIQLSLSTTTGEAAYANAVARKTRLEEEAALVADLEASMAASDLQALSRHVATCLRLGIANKHPDVMTKAKAKAAELGAQQQVRRRTASFFALIARVPNNAELLLQYCIFIEVFVLSIDEQYPTNQRTSCTPERTHGFYQVLMALANSIKSKDLGGLEAALDKANEIGLSAHPEVASATEAKGTLMKEVAADEALAAAMAAAGAAPGDEAATTALRRYA